MNLLVCLLVVTIPVALADTSSTSTTSETKSDNKNVNSIPATQKPTTYYTMPIVQHRAPYVQYIQKPIYTPQQPPTTMLIIAQPAIVPQHLLYGQAQQLLNYFHNNPHARYQFLHGYQPTQNYIPQAAQSFIAPQYTQVPQGYQTNPGIGNYQIVAAPQHFANLAPAQLTYAQTPNSQYNQLPTQSYSPQIPQTYSPQTQQTHSPTPTLNQIAQYASVAAQQYATTPLKTAPPIITGLENFTPDQQAQIKQHLNSHFAQNPVGNSQPQYVSSKYSNEQTEQSEYSSQNDSKESQSAFVPSIGYRTQYTKG